MPRGPLAAALVALCALDSAAARRVDPITHQDHLGAPARAAAAPPKAAAGSGGASLAEGAHERQQVSPENYHSVWPASWKAAYKPVATLSVGEHSLVVNASIVSKAGKSSDAFHVAVQTTVAHDALEAWGLDVAYRASKLFEGPPFRQWYHADKYLVQDKRTGTSRSALIASMELVEGPTLEEMLVPCDLGDELDIRLELFIDILDGIRTMHSSGFLHRDISPRNIRIVGDCRSRAGCHARIMDMSSACRFREDSGTWFPFPCSSRFRGVTPYLAPEVAHVVPGLISEAEEDVSAWASGKSDVWSAGLILYRILCNGTLPPSLRPSIQTAEEFYEQLMLFHQRLANDECILIRRSGVFYDRRRLYVWADIILLMLAVSPDSRYTPLEAFDEAKKAAKKRAITWRHGDIAPPLPDSFEVPYVEVDQVVRARSGGRQLAISAPALWLAFAGWRLWMR